MVVSEAVKSATQHRIRLRGRVIDYRVARSRTARKLRVRVGPEGVDVVQPMARNEDEVPAFLTANSRWLVDQIERAERLRRIRSPERRVTGEILFRGEQTRVRIETTTSRAPGNTVRLLNGEIVVSPGPGSRTPVARSLEHWLRREARRAIEAQLEIVTPRLRQGPERVYVMDQRTKWGN